MTEFRYVAEDEAATDHLGKLLADVLPPGTVIALIGTLGAGKTRLVQSIAAALGVPRDQVASPTFVLVAEYLGGRLPIYHFDAYRLKDDDEFLELGPEEYFDGHGLTFIEWADRIKRCLPQDHLTITINVLNQWQREFIVVANSEQVTARVHELARHAGQSTETEDS